MDKIKSLLESHGIAYQLQVQLSKLPITAATTTENNLKTKVTMRVHPEKSKLTPHMGILNRDSPTEKCENKLNGLHGGTSRSKCKSDKELLILNAITSHIRIHIVRQKKLPDSRKTLCKQRTGTGGIQKVYNCPICPNHVELRHGLLTKHLTTDHKSKNILKCAFPKCEFSTWVSHFLKTHLAHVHQQLPFHCSVCPKKCKNHSLLRLHMLIHSAPESKKHTCPRPNCEYACHYPASLKTHLQSHDLELKYKCPHCSWRTKYEKSIEVHLETTHGNSIKLKPFKCPQDKCNFTADKLTKVKSHSKVHSDDMPFKCHLCKFSTKYRNTIRRHLMVHSGLKPFECKLCGKKIRTSQNLQDHLRRHLRERPFQCPASSCDYAAAARSEIKLHVNQHHLEDDGAGLKSFNCPLCTKAFHRHKNLAAHIKTHTLEKPFSCIFCFRNFGTISSKRSHENCCSRRPDGIKVKPHRCEFCEKTFGTTSQKSLHEMTCKSRPDGRIVQPFKCHVEGCSFAASQTSNLKYHSNRFH